jgi:hypothetical protein
LNRWIPVFGGKNKMVLEFCIRGSHVEHMFLYEKADRQASETVNFRYEKELP